jgi:hypothetical protein
MSGAESNSEPGWWRRIYPLWDALSRAKWAEGPEDEVQHRLTVPAWESQDPSVRAAWTALTDPVNLEDLEQWGRGNLNPTAREATDKALERCRARRDAAQSGDEPG